MSGVTAVGTVKRSMSNFEMGCLLLGIALVLWNDQWQIKLLLGGPLLLFGLWAFFQPVHALLLTSSSGKVRVLASRDRKKISAIAEAVNQAIVHRH